MGEKKIKAAQVFDVVIGGKQRHTLFQVFDVAANTKDREDRKRQGRAYAALGLEEFEELKPETDEAGRVTVKGALDFDAQVARMGATVRMTYENVEAVLAAIDSGFKSGQLNGRGVRLLGPIEELMEACKRGEHLVTDAVEVPSNGTAEGAEASA